MTFTTIDGIGEHTPDFLAVSGGETWLIDVRPRDRIEPQDRVRFAAAAEVALSCGWRYIVAAGWREHVYASLDTISSQRRRLTDPLGLQDVLLDSVRARPMPFGALVAGTRVPAVARAQALHLLWQRRLSVNLAAPLADRSPIYVGQCEL